MNRGSSTDFEDLAKRMVGLEERAYEEFADLFGPRFLRYFIRRGLPAMEAEDLAVSCVSDIALKVDRYHRTQGGGFEAWVFTLVRHIWADWWRAYKETVPLPQQLVGADPRAIETGPNPEVVSAVRDALQCLTPKDREIIEFRDLGGETTYIEIGAQLGIRPGTARQRHRRALRRLQALLEKDHRIKSLLERYSAKEK